MAVRTTVAADRDVDAAHRWWVGRVHLVAVDPLCADVDAGAQVLTGRVSTFDAPQGIDVEGDFDIGGADDVALVELDRAWSPSYWPLVDSYALADVLTDAAVEGFLGHLGRQDTSPDTLQNHRTRLGRRPPRPVARLHR